MTTRSPEDMRGGGGAIVRYLLRPLIRFALRRAIKVPEIISSVKELYLHEATKEIERSGQPVTASKLSVLTGIHRKYIPESLYRRGDRDESESTLPGKKQDVITKIIGQWQLDKRFSTSKKQPRVLSCEGEQSEFATLIRSVSVDYNPYTVLFELERAGIVTRTPRGVTLTRGYEAMSKDYESAVRIVSADVEALLSTIEHNVTTQSEEKQLHLSTSFDRIERDALNELNAWIIEVGSKFHASVREKLSRYDLDITPEARRSGKTTSIRIGTFSFLDKKESHE